MTGIALQTLMQQAHQFGVPRADAELLAGFVLQVSRARIIAHPARPLSQPEEDRLLHLLQQRAQGMPCAYLIGKREFYGHTFTVTPDVLIPRADTELLIDAVLARTGEQALTLADLGTGCGALAVVFAKLRHAWQLLALEISPAALAVARRNIADAGLTRRIQILQSDWYDALPEAMLLDVIVSNPPYIADDDPELDPHVAAFEPAQSWRAANHGLHCLAQVITRAPQHLRSGGLLAVEHGHRQALAVQALMHDAGLHRTETLADLSGRPRVTLARAPASGVAPHE